MPDVVTSPDGTTWCWDGRAWRPLGLASGGRTVPAGHRPVAYYLALSVVVPIAFIVGLAGEILARAVAGAVRVVVGVFAIGAAIALLALLLSHT